MLVYTIIAVLFSIVAALIMRKTYNDNPGLYDLEISAIVIAAAGALWPLSIVAMIVHSIITHHGKE